jgi:hypothetical protein
VARDGGVAALRRAGVLPAALLLALAGAGAAVPAAGQEPAGAPGDTARADTTARGDTLPVPERQADGEEGPPPVFPALRAGPATAGPGEVRRWDREDLLDSDAVTLQDFLLDRAPGVLTLRSSFYFGPHQLMDGAFGPGALRVVVDGRELHPLETGQVDLARIALARVDQVVLVRRPGETVLRVESPTYGGGDAYSRITGGTGQPSADLIRGVFANGAGSSFSVAATVDHLNIGRTAERPGDRLDVSGRLAWVPDERTGVEILYHSDAVNREAVVEEDFDRREILVHARGEPAAGLQLDLWAGRSTRSPAPAVEEGGVPPGDGEDGDDAEDFQVDHVELSLSYAGGPVRLQADARAAGADGLPDVDAGARGSLELTPGLSLHAGADFGSWPDFSTSQFSGGVHVRPGGDGGRLSLRVGAATGTRGVPRPGAVADSLSFDALTGTATLRLGPYRLAGRGSYQEVGRQLPFGGDFDAGLEPGPGATVLGVEGRVEGPLLPLDAVAERFRIRGFWRRQEPREASDVLYVPADVARGEIRARDDFFDGNLELSGAIRVSYRSGMLSAAPGQATPVAVPSERSVDSSLSLKIDTFRLWWRAGNLQRVAQLDFPGREFPTNRNVFGVTWEFFN